MKPALPIRNIRRIALAFALGLASFSAGAQTNYTIGTGTYANFDDEYPNPFGDYYESPRQQFLYTAAETTAAGMTAGNITAIKWTVNSLNFAGIHEQFTIKIGTTAASSLSLTGWETVSTVLYGPVNYQPVTGVNTFNFSTPFAWNGTSNIVVEVCGGDPSNVSGPDQWTANATVYSSIVAFNGSRTLALDDSGNVCTYNSPENFDQQETLRPNITFVMAGTATCQAPTGVTMSAITSSGATATWTAPAGVTNFQYVVDQNAGAPSTAGTAVTGTTVTAGSLNPSTAYYFHIRSVCAGSTYSTWVNTPFTTSSAPGCTAPTAITITGTTPNSVSFGWPAATGATGYEYQVTTTATPPAAGTFITGTSITNSGLNPGTTYFAHVRTKCNSTYSTWISKAFPTNTTGIDNVNTNDVLFTVSPNPGSGLLQVVTSGSTPGNLTITDVSGRVLQRVILNSKETTVDVTSLSNGVYFIQYNNGATKQQIKFNKI
jgi:hypothetical protein